MSDDRLLIPTDGRPPRFVIAGFGLPGRALAEVFVAQRVPFSVIEANPEVFARNARTGLRMFCGDARDPEVLRSAGIESAVGLAVMIPIDPVVLEVIDAARAIHPGLRVLARTAFTSAGLEARRRGAEEVVVAEQVVATEVQVLARKIGFC
jgi:voltage-gated potassium channel Kch